MPLSAALNNITIFCASWSSGGHVFILNRPPWCVEQQNKIAGAKQILWNQHHYTFFLSDTTICNNLQFFSSENYLFCRYKFILFENCASNLIYVLNLLFFWQNFDRYLSFHLISDNLASPIFFFAYKLTIKYIIQFQITIEYRWIINPWSLVIDLLIIILCD